jgi:hypothetical protein
MKKDVVVSNLVGHRSYAMKPRQSRQVRKEATVTGRFVRSELPVSGFNFCTTHLLPPPASASSRFGIVSKLTLPVPTLCQKLHVLCSPQDEVAG